MALLLEAESLRRRYEKMFRGHRVPVLVSLRFAGCRGYSALHLIYSLRSSAMGGVAKSSSGPLLMRRTLRTFS
jgi:hypothetical protein